MPDFFLPGAPWPVDAFPPKTDEEKQKLQEFFGGPASPPKSVAKLAGIVEQIRKDGAGKVGAFGFCWGGKVTILAGSNSGSSESKLDAVAAIHPAMLSADDAKELTVPLGLYPSNDEPEDEYKKILDVVAGKPFAAKNDYHHYTNMFHGWAAARADLKNEENRKAFEDLYNRLATFFQKAL
jgi:dienelactone hydrolase